MPVLYRKYRPQTFRAVVGQKAIVQTLRNQISLGQVAHAYLFVGSRGVGKTSVARILAKAVNCLESEKRLPAGEAGKAKSEKLEGGACGECGVCEAIAAGNYIDLIEIDAASNTGVDNVRELIEHVRFSPSRGRYKVFIIDEVHMLTKGAFNALLKTLEEPPPHAIFILATTEVGKVPATIISRTQRFDFKRLGLKEIEEHLNQIIKEEKFELPEAAVRLIAERSEGGLRDALSLLDKAFTLGSRPPLEEVLQLIGITDEKILQKFLELIAPGQAEELPKFLEALLENGTDFTIFNRDFLEFLRKTLIFKITKQGDLAGLTGEQATDLPKVLALLSEGEILFITRLFLRSFKEQAFAPSPDLPVLLAGVEAALRKNHSLPVNPPPGNPQPENSQPRSAAPKIRISDSSPSLVEIPPSSGEISLKPPAADIFFEQVVGEWSKAIEKLKILNGPLAHLLRSASLERVDGGRIIVSVKYKFHKQNLEHPKNRETIGRILKQVYGRDLVVSGEVAAAPEKEKAPADGLSQALKIFGGELIE